LLQEDGSRHTEGMVCGRDVTCREGEAPWGDRSQGHSLHTGDFARADQGSWAWVRRVCATHTQEHVIDWNRESDDFIRHAAATRNGDDCERHLGGNSARDVDAIQLDCSRALERVTGNAGVVQSDADFLCALDGVALEPLVIDCKICEKVTLTVRDGAKAWRNHDVDAKVDNTVALRRGVVAN
jgi:hypothetical protein